MIAIVGWRPKKLTELAEYLNGYAFKPEDWGTEGLPIIRIEQLKNPDAPADYFGDKMPTSNIIEDGDLIFSWSASLFLKIWRHGRAALNQHLFKVIERDGVNREFLKYFIEFYLPSLTAASHGSTMQHITRKELARFKADVPELEGEQAKIAEVLSTADKAIEETEGLIAKQRRIQTGLMQNLLTRGIDENGKLRSEATHRFKDSPLGRIPEEWEVRSLVRMTTRIVDGVHHTPKYAESGVPFIVITDLTASSEISFADTRFVSLGDHLQFSKRADPRAGDVLVTKDGTLGTARIVRDDAPEFSIFVSVAMLRPNRRVCRPELIWTFFESGEFLVQLGARSAGTGLSHIHLEHFRAFLLRCPSMDEQERIFAVLNAQTELLNRTATELGKLRQLRAALMQDLISGKKRITALLDHEPQRVRAYA
jgi:type I restriction enzyme, S subunit